MPEILIPDGDRRRRVRYETQTWRRSKISGDVCHGLVRLKLPAAPPERHQQWISRFFARNQSQILRLLTLYHRHAKFNLGATDQGFIFVLGTRYFLKYSATVTHCKLAWPVCWLPSNHRVGELTSDLAVTVHTKRQVYQLLIKQFRTLFENRVAWWAARMQLGITDLKVEVKLFQSHWGKFCANSHGRTVRFNIWLIHFGQQTIDYVIIHELTHVAHPRLHHGRYRLGSDPERNSTCDFCTRERTRPQPRQDSPFWGQVRRYCPDFHTHIHNLNHVAGVG